MHGGAGVREVNMAVINETAVTAGEDNLHRMGLPCHA